MNELKDLLERGLDGFEPTTGWLPPTLVRVRRRQRRRRFAAGALALLVFAAAGTGLWAAFGRGAGGPKPAHSPDRPLPVPDSIRIAQLSVEANTLELQVGSDQQRLTEIRSQLASLEATVGIEQSPVKRDQMLAQISALRVQATALAAQIEAETSQLTRVLAELAALERTPASVSPAPSGASVPPGMEPAYPGLLLPGQPETLLAGGASLYAALSAGGGQLIYRIEPAKGAVVVRSQSLPSGPLALAGGSLWIGQGQATSTGQGSLVRLDPTTLAVLGRVTVPERPLAITAGPFGLWVGGPGHLSLVRTSDGRILNRYPIPGDVRALSVDPAGRFLYQATSKPGDISPISITERDAATGAVRVQVPSPPGVAITGLSATPAGVWVSESTGLLGSVFFLRSGDLHRTATFSIRRGWASGTNGVQGTVAGSSLWVVDHMIDRLSCADPATGKLLKSFEASPDTRYGFTAVATVGGTTYIGAEGQILRILPSFGCVP
jgi:hypothetical protein